MNTLDTDVLSHLQKRDPVGDVIATHLVSFPDQDFRITTVNVYEMLKGAIHLIQQSKNKQKEPVPGFRLLQDLYEYLTGWQGRVLFYDDAADKVYRAFPPRLRRELGNDAWIGAVALKQGAAVWTCNVEDYRRIPGLVVYSAQSGLRVS